MAPAATNATTVSAAWNITTVPLNLTTTTPYPYVYYPENTEVYYWSWYNGYVLYVVLVLMFVVALPLVAILVSPFET